MDPNPQAGQPVLPSVQPAAPTQQPLPSHQHHRIYTYIGFGLIGLIIMVLGIGLFTLSKQKKGVPNSQNEITISSGGTTTAKQSSAQQVEYKVQPLSLLKGSPSNTTSLPLGDNKYTTTGPKKGYIYLCNVHQDQGGSQVPGPWIHGTTWSAKDKISILGQVYWQNAEFKNTVSNGQRTLAGNDLPLNYSTGIFPVSSTDPAYAYDKNPNSILEQRYSDTLPVNPTFESTPSCMGGEVGIMTDGVALFNGFDAGLRDAAAHEVQDSCNGHPQVSGEYHYHSLSSCFKDIETTTVLGFALDGFPITGPILPDGNYLTTNDLDECHGMTSEIMLDGNKTTIYHYVMTQDFPYSVSCFRGKPVGMQVIQDEMQQQNNQQGTGQQVPGKTDQNQQNQGQPGGIQLYDQQSTQQQQPPQEAFSSCSGKTSGMSCSFTSPKGTVSGSCQTPPGQSQTVCVPTNNVR